MIKDYLWERKSWMALFLFLELFILFVAYLDPTIPLSSILYIVFLTTIIFVVFVIIRWKKETAFYQRLQEWERGLDPSLPCGRQAHWRRSSNASSPAKRTNGNRS